MMRTQLRPRMQLVPVTFGGSRSCNGLLSWPVEILEELLRHRVAAHSLHPHDWHSARPHAWACIVGLLEKRVFFDNPDMGYDRVLRRCANDAKFASGGLLVDALFGFGLYMGQDDIRAAYPKALEGEITCVNIDGASSQLAAAWLDLLLRQRTTAAAWRESGCALVDIVDCMLATVEATSILWASESASE